MAATVLLELEVLFADLRLTLAQRRVQRALEEMVRKYRPDQPRAPKGTPEGGEWVIDPGSARQRRLSESQNGDRIRMALAGVLVAQRVGLGDAGLVRHCIYVDMLGRTRTVEVNASVPCRATYPAAPL
jgi:hypothetical protein